MLGHVLCQMTYRGLEDHVMEHVIVSQDHVLASQDHMGEFSSSLFGYS